MYKLTYPCLLLLFFSSCIIAINENGYRELSTAKKRQLRQYPAAFNKADTIPTLVEITTQDVKSELQQNSYTWLCMWIPYCGSDNCKSPFYYDKIATDFKSRNLKLFLISSMYTGRNLQQQLSSGTFSDNMYVIKDSLYGHHANKGWRKFMCEIVDIDTICRSLSMHTVFKKDKVIYHGSAMSASIMDSVLRNN